MYEELVDKHFLGLDSLTLYRSPSPKPLELQPFSKGRDLGPIHQWHSAGGQGGGSFRRHECFTKKWRKVLGCSQGKKESGAVLQVQHGGTEFPRCNLKVDDITSIRSFLGGCSTFACWDHYPSHLFLLKDNWRDEVVWSRCSFKKHWRETPTCVTCRIQPRVWSGDGQWPDFSTCAIPDNGSLFPPETVLSSIESMLFHKRLDTTGTNRSVKHPDSDL